MGVPVAHLPRLSTRPALEVADVFRRWGDRYLEAHPVTLDQLSAMRAVVSCRTSALGGHADECNVCGYSKPSYNSCRSRCCNRCQGGRQAAWVAERGQRLLPTAHFHCVFTLPAELRLLVKQNPRLTYDLLLRMAAQTLLALGKDQRHLGALVGATLVLHTWNRDLSYGPHAHAVVTAGGLSADGGRWIPNRWGPKYLFPVRVLGSLFRGKFLRALGRAYRAGNLELIGPCEELADPDVFAELLADLHSKDWNVYAKAPFGGARRAVKYLGRYVSRIGLSNQRLLSVDDQGVCFRTKDGRSVLLSPFEFIRRYLQHVPPKGFVRVRHVGLYSAANVSTKLLAARALLAGDAEDREPQSASEPLEPDPGAAATCPECLFGVLARYEVEPSRLPLPYT